MDSIVLTREIILKALQELSDELAKQNVKGEICLFGGTVMVLAFGARVSTKDVDAIFHPTPIIRSLAAKIAIENDLPEDWLNDGVKGFTSTKHNVTRGNLPQFSNLSLTMPAPEYLLAMKCMASRISMGADEASGDVGDIIFLIRYLKLKSPSDVLDIVAEYYPANRIPVKAQFLIEGLFEGGGL